MKRVLKAIFNFFFTSNTHTAPTEINVYRRDPSEPSPFLPTCQTDGKVTINPWWLTWYMDKHSESFKNAVIAGYDLQVEMLHSRPEVCSAFAPDLLVTVKHTETAFVQGRAVRCTSERIAISLWWVIWACEEFNMTPQEAHDFGYRLSNCR